MKKLKVILSVVFALSIAAFVGTSFNIVKADNETKTFASFDYTVANADWADTTVDNKGFIQEKGQLTLVNDATYDAPANGAWLTYKVEASAGKLIDTLQVNMVGNRLGSFGKAVSATTTTVDFKPYISTEETFGEPIETITLPEKSDQYNLDYDFSSYLGQTKSKVYYIKLWVGGTGGNGFYYDWFQLGKVAFVGTEKDNIVAKTFVDADYTGTTTIESTCESVYGLKKDNTQVVFVVEGGIDAAANGGWIVYKCEATNGYLVNSLRLDMVGNRLGSWAKANGVSSYGIEFKGFISTTNSFSDTPSVSQVLENKKDIYDFNIDLTNYLPETKSKVIYVKVWFGSDTPGCGMCYDWFQFGKLKLSGTEYDTGIYVEQTDASNATISLSQESYERTGSAVTPAVTVTLGETTLTNKVDYDVAYSNNISIGQATITVTFKNLYKGQATKTFQIVKESAINYNDDDLQVVEGFHPEAVDFVDYYSACGDIKEEDGDGVTTFAHCGLTIPLKGQAIKMRTSMMLLSKNADSVDGWLTYSFSASQADATSDRTIPYYGGSVSGYFLHVTNYSSTTTPNCVEVQFVQSVEGSTTTLDSFFVDNAVTNSGILKNDTIVFDLSLTKGTDNWTLKMVNVSTQAVLIEKTYEILNERLFINEKGQTFFGTAIYEGAGCDGEHWNHRGINIYSADVYTVNAADAVATLSQTTYDFEDGTTYKPAVTVKLGEATLVKDVDYFVEYKNNKAVGNASAIVTFIGNYAGNASKTLTFEIKEVAKQPEDNEEPKTDTEKKGCGSTMAMPIAVLALASVAFVLKKKED